MVLWYLLLGFPQFTHLFEPSAFWCTLAALHMLLIGLNSLQVPAALAAMLRGLLSIEDYIKLRMKISIEKRGRREGTAVPVKFNVLVTQRLLLLILNPVIKGAAIASTAGLGRCPGGCCYSHRVLSIKGQSYCAPAAGRFVNRQDQWCSNTGSY